VSVSKARTKCKQFLDENVPVVKVRFLMVGTADRNLVRIVPREVGVSKHTLSTSNDRGKDISLHRNSKGERNDIKEQKVGCFSGGGL
jgi:hypothetical protein